MQWSVQFSDGKHAGKAYTPRTQVLSPVSSLQAPKNNLSGALGISKLQDLFLAHIVRAGRVSIDCNKHKTNTKIIEKLISIYTLTIRG